MTAFGGLAPQPVKRPTELGPVTFDFTNCLAVGETISTQVVTPTVYSGVDGNPAAILSGAASASGKIVSQKIATAVTGVIYQLVCVITTSLSNTYHQQSYFAIAPALV